MTNLLSWLTSSLARVFPDTPARRNSALEIEGALNEQLSAQVAVRWTGEKPLVVRCCATMPAGWSVRIRRVGYVPVAHHNTPVEGPADTDGLGRIPGFVPDPLFEEDAACLGPHETHTFWITIRPGRAAQAGRHKLLVTLLGEGQPRIKHTISVRLHDCVLPKRRGFDVTQWFYADAIIDWYKTSLFDRRFWEVLAPYLRNMADHGQNSVYVPVFTPPLDGVKRPTQLLRVQRRAADSFEFDWRDVKHYLDLARRSGLDRFEWCHPFTQWGARHAIRVYDGQGENERRLWPPSTGATSRTYRLFMAQYLPALHSFLARERLLKTSFFHVSDEPHGAEHLASYRKARAMLKELAPWMNVMDALTEIDYGRQHLTDMPIPSISAALDFVREDIPCWCYYCCGPRGRYLNRLMDTPLAKIAMHGFLFYRWPFRGFLHWGYNYWHQRASRSLLDPYAAQDGLAWQRGWAYGDTFCVYPGPNGPVDSMRWEVFGESLQDYRLLQLLDVPRSDRQLSPLRSFRDFPKSASWRLATRARLLREAAGG